VVLLFPVPEWDASAKDVIIGGAGRLLALFVFLFTLPLSVWLLKDRDHHLRDCLRTPISLRTQSLGLAALVLAAIQAAYTGWTVVAAFLLTAPFGCFFGMLTRSGRFLSGAATVFVAAWLAAAAAGALAGLGFVISRKPAAAPSDDAVGPI